MASVTGVCQKCGIENSSDSVYCRKCGANLAGQTLSGDLTRQVIQKAREEAISRGVAWTFDTIIIPAVSAVSTAVILRIVDGSRSFWEWLVLTWPLTAAVALIIVLLTHPLRNSGWMGQSLISAGILWAAAFAGTSASGTPVNFSPVAAPGPLRPLVGMLAGFFAAYGFWPFFLSFVAGALIGGLWLALIERNT